LNDKDIYIEGIKIATMQDIFGEHYEKQQLESPKLELPEQKFNNDFLMEILGDDQDEDYLEYKKTTG